MENFTPKEIKDSVNDTSNMEVHPAIISCINSLLILAAFTKTKQIFVRHKTLFSRLEAMHVFFGMLDENGFFTIHKESVKNWYASKGWVSEITADGWSFSFPEEDTIDDNLKDIQNNVFTLKKPTMIQ